MKIYNVEKTQKLNIEDIDLNLGRLKADKLFIAHHDAIEAKPAVYGDEIEVLPNGSKQNLKPLISPAVEAKEAEDVYEDIQVFVLYTKEELRDIKRNKRKQLFIAFDTYKSNVDYGIEPETEIQHEDMIAWYEDLLDLKEIAFENVPERIKYYLEKSHKNS